MVRFPKPSVGQSTTGRRSTAPERQQRSATTASDASPPTINSKVSRRQQNPDQASRAAVLTPEVLLHTVEALYADRVIPQASLLQWRLQSDLGIKICAHELRNTATSIPSVYISGLVGAKGLAFSILLRVKPDGFEGFADEAVSDPVVCSDLLIEAAIHLLQGGWNNADDPRHDKYEVTNWIRSRSMQLSTLPWGQVLRIVRWFMANSVQVLGKKGNRIVPYPLSDNFDKEENARLLRPTGLRPGEKYVSTWEELVECLEILMELGDGWARISELKKNFRAEFGLELTETALGHTTLFSLLMDERCASAVALEKIDGADAIWLRRSRPGDSHHQLPEDVRLDDLAVQYANSDGIFGQQAPQLGTPPPRKTTWNQRSTPSAPRETPQKPMARAIERATAAVRLASGACPALKASDDPRKPSPFSLERHIPDQTQSLYGLPPLPAFCTNARMFEVDADVEPMVEARQEAIQLASGAEPAELKSKQELQLGPENEWDDELCGVQYGFRVDRGDAGTGGAPYNLPPWCRVQNTFLVATATTSAPASMRALSSPPRLSF